MRALLVSVLAIGCTVPALEIEAADEAGRGDLSRVTRWHVTSDESSVTFEGLGADETLEFSLTLRNAIAADGTPQSIVEVDDAGVGSGSLILDTHGAILADNLPEGDLTGNLLALAIDTHAAAVNGGDLGEYPAARMCLTRGLRNVLPATCGELRKYQTRSGVLLVASIIALLAGTALDWNPGGWILTAAGIVGVQVSAVYLIVLEFQAQLTECRRRGDSTFVDWGFCDFG